MSEVATRKDIDEVIDIMKDFMAEVAEVHKKINAPDQRYDHLITTIDGFISRIDRYEVELAARDSQFERLLAWARKVSQKRGIPLENI